MRHLHSQLEVTYIQNENTDMKIGINKPVKEILYENQKITERSLSAEH